MDVYPPLPPPPGGVPAPEAPVAADAPRSTGKVVVAIVGLVATIATVTVGGWLWIGRPGICDASTIESARFGYCLDAPGWAFTNAEGTELPYDELVHPVDDSSVRILAIELPAGQGLDEVVEQARSAESDEGVEPGEVSDRRVAGVPAAQWDISLESASLEIQIREVVFVRDGTAWRVQLLTEREAFDTRLDDFEQILRSWTFR
jgi:hypothetical protein